MQIICIVRFKNIIHKNCVQNCGRLSFAVYRFILQRYTPQKMSFCVQSNDTIFPRTDTREKMMPRGVVAADTRGNFLCN